MLTFFSLHRVTAMRVVAALMGLFFVIGTAPQAMSPWGNVTLANYVGVHDPNLHRWSAALAGGPDLGAAVVLFYLVWRPLRAPLALQWLALIVIVFLVANVPFVGPAVALIAVPIVLVLLLYPRPGDLWRSPWSEGVDWPLLGLATLIAILLVADGFAALTAQVRGADEVAANYDWAADGEHLINIGLAALLAGMNRAGARLLGIVAGGVVAFLGAAAVTVPDNPGSWGALGGAVGIVVGVIFLAMAAYEWRRRGERLEPRPA